MASKNNSNPRRIVILGGGFGGAYTLLNLHKHLHGREDMAVTLVNSTNYFLFTPLLHEVATGGVALPLVAEPLRGILRCCLRNLVVGQVERIDVEQQLVVTSCGELTYDVLVIALGSTTDFFGVSGAAEHAFALKTLKDALRLKNHIVDRFEKALRAADLAERSRLLRFVVVGGGPTGVEMAAELADLCFATVQELYPGAGFGRDIEVVLVQADDTLLPRLPPEMGEKSLKVLRNKDVDVRLSKRVTSIDDGGVVLDSGERLDSTTVIWVAGIKPQPISFVGDVPRDEAGRIMVEPTLQVVGHNSVFALGDIAHAVNPRDGQLVQTLAQVASKQAVAVATNVAALIQEKQLTPYHYRHAGDLVSLGYWRAVARVYGMPFSGRFAWWLWRTVYLAKMLTWKKKLKVVIDWTWDLFNPRDIAQLP